MKNIEALLQSGGGISVDTSHHGQCWATANDGHNSLAMLVRRDGETLKTDRSGSTRDSHGVELTTGKLTPYLPP